MQKAAFFIILQLAILCFGCVTKSESSELKALVTPRPLTSQPTVQETQATSTNCKSPKEIAIDLCNYSYPGIWNKKPLTLKDGGQEYETSHQFVRNDLQEIELIDFTNDGKPEVLVTINNISGGGSSCSMIHYYLFQLKNRQPSLIWKFTTGCESSCGIKGSSITDGKLNFELFGDCQVRKGVARNIGRDFSDVETDSNTSLSFGNKQGKFQLISRSVERFERRAIR